MNLNLRFKIEFHGYKSPIDNLWHVCSWTWCFGDNIRGYMYISDKERLCISMLGNREVMQVKLCKKEEWNGDIGCVPFNLLDQI